MRVMKSAPRLFTPVAMAAAALAAVAALGGGPAWASKHVVGGMSTRPGDCAPGFKVQKSDKTGYVCASEVIKCPGRPVAYVTSGETFDKKSRRFVYVCGVPAK